MKELWSKRCEKLTPYVPGEQPQGRRFIKLNTNENPYPPSHMVLRAIQEAANDLRLYPNPSCESLRRLLRRTRGSRRDRFLWGMAPMRC